MRSPRPMPARGQPLDALLDVGDQLGVGELHVAVVERGSVGMALGGGVQDVDQRARLGRLRDDNRYWAGMSGRGSVVTTTNY